MDLMNAPLCGLQSGCIVGQALRTQDIGIGLTFRSFYTRKGIASRPVARACSYRLALCLIPYFRMIAVTAPYFPRALMKSRSIASRSWCKQTTQNAWPSVELLSMISAIFCSTERLTFVNRQEGHCRASYFSLTQRKRGPIKNLQQPSNPCSSDGTTSKILRAGSGPTACCRSSSVRWVVTRPFRLQRSSPTSQLLGFVRRN